MVTDLPKVLDQMRLRSQSEFEKGEYFERLVKVFFKNDDLQKQYYDKVWHYRDWAAEHGLPTKDIGIDLFASNSDGLGFCAVQCKFYAPHWQTKAVLCTLATCAAYRFKRCQNA